MASLLDTPDTSGATLMSGLQRIWVNKVLVTVTCRVCSRECAWLKGSETGLVKVPADRDVPVPAKHYLLV